MDVLRVVAPESPFQAPSLFWHIITRPIHFVLLHVHAFLVSLRGSRNKCNKDKIRIVCISDTHTFKPSIPEGDVLIHAGDLTNEGTVAEIQPQIDWLSNQPHQYIIAIAGNHDSYFDPKSRMVGDNKKQLDFKRVRYLQHSGTTLEFGSKSNRRLRIHGAPQIPECGGDEHAFQYRREDDAWTDTLPQDIDILITHTPPKWHLDLPWGMGCHFLLKEVWKVKPELHIFGHVHAGRGKQKVYWDEAQKAYEKVMSRQRVIDILNLWLWIDCMRVIAYDLVGILWTRVWGAESQGTTMVNSAIVDYYGKVKNPPQTIDL
ncbi:MAG: hypothetical protein GOMPHAMPRED_006937 [Gomphillus americanus]|uniref:Calcineurin-like phosphoesterase domain-containing protein n=1 Tax=Gomphillus americanus TaxID=1940652 RepID=A0A8H3ER09_9LECA|nr:MAG: hypothetical protein GOMPHAMPRED_006937 [Gomphillus americanus]